MKPVIHKGHMAALGEDMRRRVCKHDKKCTHYLVINLPGEGTMICAKDAEQFIVELSRFCNVSRRVSWTTREEEILRQLYYEHGTDENGRMKYGACRLIAKELGTKTREQVKGKITKMRLEGRL